MKRELVAGLLLAILFAASLFNISYSNRLTAKIEVRVSASSDALEKGDKDAALEHIKKALEIWLDAEDYTHIFIRHPEIDSTTDAFYELTEAIGEDETESCRAAYDKLLYHLESIKTMEHLRFGSIM